MKFVQFLKYSVRNIFLQKPCRNEVGRLVLDCFLLVHTIKINAITFQRVDPEVY